MKKKSHLTSERNPEALILSFFDRVWHPPHELAAIDELMTADYTVNSAGKIIKGREAFKAWVKEFHQMLPEAKTESRDIFFNASENKAVSRWVCSGKNNGIFGLPPDGQWVSFTGIAIWTIRDNRLASCWIERSAYELYRELTTATEKK